EYVEFLAAEAAAVACVRVQGGDRDARTLDARGTQVAVDDVYGVAHTVLSYRCRHRGERDVRGHGRCPQLAGDVELGDEAGNRERVLQEPHLVLVLQSGDAHRMLV